MYHVHENVVVVGIDLSGFSMYYLFKKIRFVVGIENVVVVVCTQQAAGKRNPPALPALPNGNGETTPTRGFSPGVQAGMEDQKNSRWRVLGTGYSSLRCQSRP